MTRSLTRRHVNGGNNGRTLQLKAGDAAILPAGTGHHCLSASANFLVVGAYPPSGTYDECTKSEEHAQVLKTVLNRPPPEGSRLRRSGATARHRRPEGTFTRRRDGYAFS